MTDLLTAAQMRAIEHAAIESGAVTGLELMERAGQGVVEAIFEEWPELASPRPGATGGDEYLEREEAQRAVVLCGPGNNGGDGFVVARLLQELGWVVEVFLYGDPDKLPPDARANYERWLAIGSVSRCEKVAAEDQFDLLHALATQAEPVVFIDALFGTGLSRPFLADETGWQVVLGNSMSHPSIHRVSIDVPSGLCSDSGRDIGQAFIAELTVAFHQAKLGQCLAKGPSHCGKVVTKSIGLEAYRSTLSPVETVQAIEVGSNAPWSRSTQPLELQKLQDHKFSYGHAVVMSGGSCKTGAARLSARGALRVGAGLVTLGVPDGARLEVASQVTSIMMCDVDNAEDLAGVLEDNRLNALCLGPGLGLERARALVPAALAAKRATVLDADALTAFADAPEALFAQLHEGCVLTPHGGEFRRLFPDIAAKLVAVATRGPAYSKVDATREAAARAGCVVLFKGPDTVIAAPDGRCAINAAFYDCAAPWLATAGSGDVLAGFITGLLARGFDPMGAAETGAWLHVECARAFGPGLIAEDLPEMLPQVFRDLGL